MILPACRALGISVVLARGLLGGHWQSGAKQPDDFRAGGPRFQPNNVEHNLALADGLRGAAVARGATVAQVAIAWVAAEGPDIVPLVRARRRDRLTEALGALEIDLGPADLAAIDAAMPKDAAAGTRCPALQIPHLDSEAPQA